MFSLNKILPAFILPLGLALIFLLIGWRSRRWLWVGMAAFVLYGCSIVPVSQTLMHFLENLYPESSVAGCPPADAIVVCSGFLAEGRGEDKVMNFGEASERLEAGVLLWKAGKAERLWILNDGGDAKSRRLVGELHIRGVLMHPSIRIEGPARNTMDEARIIAAAAKKENLASIILVTTGWHMPRAARLFRRTGLEIVAFPVDFQTPQFLGLPGNPKDYFPSARSLWQTEVFFREMMGILFYRLAGS